MTTDRNLLFGVLALQTDLIDSKQFIEVRGAWAARRDSPLADILVERGWITPADKADVEKLVERKLLRFGGDVRASLAVVSLFQGFSRSFPSRPRALPWADFLIPFGANSVTPAIR